jgi:hypothetical protein
MTEIIQALRTQKIRSNVDFLEQEAGGLDTVGVALRIG